MAISISKWFRDKFGRDSKFEIDCAELRDAGAEYAIRDLAFKVAVNKIARSIAKCEVKTFNNGKEVKGADYYRLNIQPNRNANSSEWFQKLLSKLYRDNEALIVGIDGDLLIADSFSKKKYALYDWTFSDVIIDEYELKDTFKMSDVYYFRLNNESIKKAADKVYEAHAKMMDVAKKMYERHSGIRGILTIPGIGKGDVTERQKVIDMHLRHFKKLTENANFVYPLDTGYAWQEIGGSGKREIMNTRDYRSLIDDAFDFTAVAFGIPPVLLKGQVAGVEDVYNIYLSDCIDPLADHLETELNRKMYGQKHFLKGRYLKIDTRQIKHFELFEIAASIDKLIGSGTLTINEVRDKIGELPSTDPAADTHLVTKNYGTAEEVTGNATEQKENDG